MIKPLLLGPGLFSILFLSCSFTSISVIHAKAFSQNDIPIILLDAKTEEPLIGVHIYTADFKFTTTSDIDGKAIISNLGYRDIVFFSYTGYKPLKLAVYEIRRQRGIIKMEEDVIELAGIEVVGRRDDPINEMPFKIERITNKDIQFNNAQTSADLLEKNGNLFVQKSQMGGGSPIVRGFEANRVLLVVDGVRMNNAIYRNGHLQNSITIDPAILEQAEVIFGPGSLTYGSDALGGVIHYRTKDPQLAYRDSENLVLKTNASLRYAYANSEKSFHVDFNQGRKKWGTLTSFSFVDYDNLIAGSKRPEEYPDFGLQKFYSANILDPSRREKLPNEINPNKQWGTEYSQIDFLQKIKFQPSDNLYFVGNLQWSSSSPVPRYDNLVDTVAAANDLKWIEWFYGPQQRFLASVKARMLNQKYFDRGTIIASFQRIDEDRNQRKWANNWRSVSEVDVYVYSLTADFDKFLDKEESTIFTFGFDLSHNNVLSEAYEIYVHNGSQKGDLVFSGNDIITRYPSQGSKMDAYGTYANLKWKSKNQVLSAEGGLRYSYVKLSGFFGENDPISWPQNYIDGIYLKNNALTFGAGLTVNTQDKWQFRVLTASAFRSPNIDDFAQIREKNGFITVPNTNLKPEESLNIEATIGKEFGAIKTDQSNGKKSGLRLYLSGTAFYTHLKNAMVRQNFSLPDGSITLFKDEEILEVQANVNATTATVKGLSGNVNFKISDKFEWQSNINYTLGRSRFQHEIEGIQIDTMVPLAHIPPLYGKTSIIFQLGNWRISPVIRFNGRKRPNAYSVGSARLNENGQVYLRRVGTSDNIDYTPYGYINPEGDPCTPSPNNADCQLDYAGSLSWTTYNLYTEYQINERFSLNLSLENLTDLHYRPFSSGVSAAGRNFILGIRGNF